MGLEHAELDKTPSEHTQSANETHGHEHTQQDVIQHHGHELPLLCSLREKRESSLKLGKTKWNKLHGAIQDVE